MGKLKITWTIQAKTALKKIYEFYKPKSLQGAKNVRKDLLHSPKTISFPEQYQVDEINPKYRRIVVRDYKVLFRVVENEVFVVDIIGTKRSPEILKNVK